MNLLAQKGQPNLHHYLLPNLHTPIVWGVKAFENSITSCDPTGAEILDNPGCEVLHINRQKDRHYQVYYLPALQSYLVSNECHSSGNVTLLPHQVFFPCKTDKLVTCVRLPVNQIRNFLHSIEKRTRHHVQWKRLSVDAPSRVVPSLSMFFAERCHGVTSRDVLTSWRDVTWRCDVMSWISNKICPPVTEFGSGQDRHIDLPMWSRLW